MSYSIATHRRSVFSSAHLNHPQDIRILRLEPARNYEDALKGELVVKNLNYCPTYHALSYTWDPPFDGQVLQDDSLSIVGIPLTIGGNLAHALRALRGGTVMRPLWIDAICIDQQNVDERNSQVRMMASIYLTAEVVFAWLGNDTAERDGEFAISLGIAVSRAFPGREMPDDQVLELVEDHCDKWSGPRPGELVERFTQRRYFKRRWIMQELYHGASIWVVCGRHKLSWDDFLKTLKALQDVSSVGDTPRLEHDSSMHLLEHMRSAEWMRDAKADNAVASLCAFRDLGCLDEKDKLIALSSLWNHGFFSVDYTVSTHRLYLKFAMGLVRQASSSSTCVHQLLFVAGYQAGVRGSVQELPSWVPDWRLRVPQRMLGAASESLRAPSAKITTNRELETNLETFGHIESISHEEKCVTILRTPEVATPEQGGTEDMDVLWRIRARSEAADQAWQALREHCPSIQRSDVLAYPALPEMGTGCLMALVLRPTHSGTVIRCRVVGLFPMRLLGGQHDVRGSNGVYGGTTPSAQSQAVLIS